MGIYFLVMLMKIEIKERAIARLNELNLDFSEKALRIRVLNYS